jgi:translation initiation factor IF-3
VKEIQLSPKIDPHDLSVKVQHAVDFLCEDMKVKVTLKFRGREMAHKEIGFQVMSKFVSEITPFGHPDFEPKLIGKGINAMISPLPRNKRAKNPKAGQPRPEIEEEVQEPEEEEQDEPLSNNGSTSPSPTTATPEAASFNKKNLEQVER